MIAPNKDHSAVVTMELRAGDVRVPLSQLGHDFAIAAEAVKLPPCEGEVLMTIDGATTRMPVFLREGAGLDQRRIELSNTSDITPPLTSPQNSEHLR